ncbi:MAG: hypothetical protein ACI4ND_03620 [Succinivibrio sp.]
MHAYKKIILNATLALLLPFGAYAADDDGTFTITIQGPEVEDLIQRPAARPVQRPARTQAAAPRRATTPATPAGNAQRATAPQVNAAPAVNRQNATPAQPNTNATAANATPATPSRTYTVAAGDTIWSVAHKYLPQDRSFNEFQIVAAIYRNNPNAFLNRNVNQLTRTTITIPDDKEIARESMQAGSQLLARGSMELPPLASPVSDVRTETAEASNESPQTAAQDKQVTQNGASIQAETKKDSDIPEYTATETKIRMMQEEQKNKELGELIPADSNGADNDKSDEEDKAKEKKTETKDVASTKAEVAVDTQAIRIMLEENKRSIDQKTKVLEQQLAEAMERMKKSSAATAKTAADSVATLSGQYDKIISGLQQDIIEIKGALSKLSQDNDRMREMLLANDEKIEDMQLQLSQFSIASPASELDLNRPMMMILFGAGLLSLVMLIVFLIFKAKSRANARVFSDDFDVDDDFGNEDTLLSDENGTITLEDNIGDTDAEEQKTEDTEQPKAEVQNEEVTKKEPPKEEKSDVEKILEEDDSDGEVFDEVSDAAQAEWDKAATTENKKSLKDSNESVLSEWSKALDEQSEDEKSVDVSSTDEQSVADDLKEKSSSSAEDEMANAWAQALNEQEKSEKAEDTPVNEQEAMASAWAQALDEQENSEKAEDTPVNEQEAMENAMSKALNESSDEQKSEPEQNSDEEPSVEPLSEAVEQEASSELNIEKDNAEFGSSQVTADTGSIKEQELSEELPSDENTIENSTSLEPLENTSAAIPQEDLSSKTESNSVVVEDVSEEELLAEFENSAKASSQDGNEGMDSDNPESLDNSFDTEDNSKDNLTDNSQNLENDEVSDANSESQSDDSQLQSELSGEEKAFLEAVSSNQTKLSQTLDIDSQNNLDGKVDEAEPKPDERAQGDLNSSNKNLGTKVDEVLNDDLNLEELLTEDSSDADAASDENSSEAYENISEDTDINSDDSITDDNGFKADTDDLSTESDVSDTNPEEEELFDSDTITQNTSSLQDGSEETSDETYNEPKEAFDSSVEQDDNSDVVSWTVPEEEFDIVNSDNSSKNDAESVDNALGNENAIEEDNTEEPQNVADSSTEVAEPEDNNSPDLSLSQEDMTGTEDSLENTQEDFEESSDTPPFETDLKELESRMSSSASIIDPDADRDIMNMLSAGVDKNDSLPYESEDKAFSADDIVSMMSSATHINEDTISEKSDFQLEESAANEVGADSGKAENSLESVSDVIGPISDENDNEQDINAAAPSYEGLTPKEHQYYVDELNLARLYFETGDTEEALKIIDDVKEHGSDDLKLEASKIIETYGN